MTATTRVGFHQYTFPAIRQRAHHPRPDARHLQLRRQERLDVRPRRERSHDRRLSPDERLGANADGLFRDGIFEAVQVYGFKNFGKEDYKGFWRKFDQTKNFPEMAGKQIRAYFDFKTAANEKIQDQVCAVAGFDRGSDVKS